MSETLIDRFKTYLDSSPSSFHAASNAANWLEAAGFEALDDGGPPHPLEPGSKCYVQRSGSLIAFRVGTAPPPEAGFRMVAAHTDSPNLRIKPRPYKKNHGYVRLGLEVYGGVLLATWPDRDLGIAGRIALRDGSTQLVDLRRPLCRIPNLAIHLNRGVNSEGLKLNEQKHLPAVLALDEGTSADPLRDLLAEAADVDGAEILAWDLGLYDLTPAAVAGLNGEFLYSARLDNLASCHAGLEALTASLDTEMGPTAVLALFDHEEIGSTSERGARSALLHRVLERVATDATNQAGGGVSRALANSLLVSADMAHAVHPAYADKHDGEHMPKLNEGPVIKQHVAQRYGTESDTAATFLRLCEAADAPSQWFVNRTDLACGSTVGPLVAATLGVRTVDVGNPMLSMHSAREMCGTKDQAWMVGAMTQLYRGT